MLNEPRLRRWLQDVRAGRRSPGAVIEALQRWPTDHLRDARLDTHRRLRRGLPEVVLCDGKSHAQLAAILRRLASLNDLIILTRLQPDRVAPLQRIHPALRYDSVARIAYALPAHPARRRGCVAVVTGGTSDMPVAEEAALTLELLGSRAQRLYDVGVAGLHRLLEQWLLLRRARAIIVIAGMEGALPSVVAGLVSCPVIAVPTSVGYGAHFQGIAPLLAMLNSCAPGIGVVNIDNGFGAAYLAHTINQPVRRPRS